MLLCISSHRLLTPTQAASNRTSSLCIAAEMCDEKSTVSLNAHFSPQRCRDCANVTVSGVSVIEVADVCMSATGAGCADDSLGCCAGDLDQNDFNSACILLNSWSCSSSRACNFAISAAANANFTFSTLSLLSFSTVATCCSNRVCPSAIAHTRASICSTMRPCCSKRVCSAWTPSSLNGRANISATAWPISASCCACLFNSSLSKRCPWLSPFTRVC
mmetsp:Transcript_95955/g.150101  ORF Transcript_95955/g.150101 Transcript_95955/m.150101 type:complete len:218 (+) Transcript_95955:219-872(+)